MIGCTHVRCSVRVRFVAIRVARVTEMCHLRFDTANYFIVGYVDCYYVSRRTYDGRNDY